MANESSTSPSAPFPPGDFPEHGHDHAKCVHDALARAKQLCQDHGVRLTDIRLQVLEAVWRGHRPVGAYEILDSLQAGGKRVQPPTVYRALEFLMEQGLIHRIESLNAYIGCAAPNEQHDSQFLICRSCGMAAELIDKRVDRAIHKSAEALGFEVEHPTVELEGVCAECRRAQRQSDKRGGRGHD